MFNILGFIDYMEVLESHRTWYRCVCPICKSDKLKINKYSGAYSCYANNCHVGGLIKSYFTGCEPNIYRVMEDQYVKPVPYKFLSRDKFENDIKYKPPKKYNGKTIYNYNDVFSVYRFDFGSNKVFDLSEVPNEPNSNFIYRKEYCQKAIILVEGEKNADDGQRLNLNVVSYLQSKLSFDNLCKSFKSFSIEGAIIIEDNDETGKKKSQIILRSMWALLIPAKVVNLAEIYGIDKRGFDLSDALELKLFNIEDIL